MSWGAYTSNQEYGRGVVMSMQKAGSKAYNGMSSPWMNSYPQIGHQQAFTPGHAHAPNCPNFGVGMSQANQNQSYGQVYGKDGKVLGATSGVFSTGGDSATDFTVYVGEEAIAKLGENEKAQVQALQQQPNVNYYIPQQPNVTAGGNPIMNIENSAAPAAPVAPTQSQTQHFGNNAQNPQQYSYAQQGIQGSAGQSLSGSGQKKPQEKNKGVRFECAVPPYNAAPQPPVIRSLGNKYRNRQILDRSSLDFIPGQQLQSGVRGVNSKPKFQLCGRCSKCKSLKDPNSSAPSIMNFKTQGLTSSGSRRFPIPTAFPKPKPTKSTPNMSTVGHTMPGNVKLMPKMVGNPMQMSAGDAAAVMTSARAQMLPENGGKDNGKTEMGSVRPQMMSGNLSGDGNPNIQSTNASAAAGM